MQRLQTQVSALAAVAAPQPQLLSVDRQLDVGLLVLLQQVGQPHAFVPTAQHALFDAGGLDLADEALQRLQAAAERCSVAQARTRQAAAQLGAVAAERWVQLLRRRRLLLLGVWVEVCVEVRVGQSHLSRPGCARTRCQYLRGVTVAVWGGNHAVPERGEVLRDRIRVGPVGQL